MLQVLKVIHLLLLKTSGSQISRSRIISADMFGYCKRNIIVAIISFFGTSAAGIQITLTWMFQLLSVHRKGLKNRKVIFFLILYFEFVQLNIGNGGNIFKDQYFSSSIFLPEVLLSTKRFFTKKRQTTQKLKINNRTNI